LEGKQKSSRADLHRIFEEAIHPTESGTEKRREEAASSKENPISGKSSEAQSLCEDTEAMKKQTARGVPVEGA